MEDARVREEDKKKRQEKMTNYSKIVKQMYWPKVSDKKVMELEMIKQNVSTKNNVRRSVQYRRGELSLRNDHSVDDLEGHKTDTGEIPKTNRKPVNWKKNKNPLAPSRKDGSKSNRSEVMKSVDYLAEMRTKRAS